MQTSNVKNTKTGQIVAVAVTREIALVIARALRAEYRDEDFLVE